MQDWPSRRRGSGRRRGPESLVDVVDARMMSPGFRTMVVVVVALAVVGVAGAAVVVVGAAVVVVAGAAVVVTACVVVVLDPQPSKATAEHYQRGRQDEHRPPDPSSCPWSVLPHRSIIFAPSVYGAPSRRRRAENARSTVRRGTAGQEQKDPRTTRRSPSVERKRSPFRTGRHGRFQLYPAGPRLHGIPADAGRSFRAPGLGDAIGRRAEARLCHGPGQTARRGGARNSPARRRGS